MAADPSFIEEIAGQARLDAALSWRKMFGEYALYLDGKVVALVCDNQLFVKSTEAGHALLEPEQAMGAPFPGARPHLLIDPVEQSDVLSRLLRATAAALPLPKPRPRKTGKASAAAKPR
ncbi:TfoX/Sxy family protein [Pseudoxanthomonas composti]|uniref:TfoX N-terminal domain-containing protein n=1 Tax=Pseudoxanthomonas composti TaxID=2137479 RepID=A0A4Q1K060_9GAMM|nr:TfoX/Sxy family protein [Pseudoxanthomonas composti]RXR08769.1 hypothetical protein EPA99_02855 [Pseudoxanthomonas composti]